MNKYITLGREAFYKWFNNGKVVKSYPVNPYRKESSAATFWQTGFNDASGIYIIQGELNV